MSQSTVKRFRLSGSGLVKSYTLPHKRVDVLKHADLCVEASERVAIVGKSGAGKSTLLHVLGALDRPESGEVFIGDRSIYKLTQRQRSLLRARDIGFVFQSYHLLPEMDVLENVMLPAMAAGNVSRSRMRAKAMDLLKQVGLDDRATHTPLELSGGEQQRAALARALINDPGLILADEPTGNLDRNTGRQILDLLFGLSSQAGHTLVMVTHAPEIAAMCDRTLALENGVLVDTSAYTSTHES